MFLKRDNFDNYTRVGRIYIPKPAEPSTKVDDEVYYRRNQIRTNNVLMFVNIILVCGTLISGFYNGLQSKVSAQASMQSAQFAGDTLHQTQAAHLTTSTAMSSTDFRQIDIPISNRGAVAAKLRYIQFAYRRYVQEGLLPLEERTGFEKMEEVPKVSSGDHVMNMSIEAFGLDTDQIQLGKEYVTVSGRIFYDSGFGEEEATPFCYMYGYKGDRSKWGECPRISGIDYNQFTVDTRSAPNTGTDHKSWDH